MDFSLFANQASLRFLNEIQANPSSEGFMQALQTHSSGILSGRSPPLNPEETQAFQSHLEMALEGLAPAGGHLALPPMFQGFEGLIQQLTISPPANTQDMVSTITEFLLSHRDSVESMEALMNQYLIQGNQVGRPALPSEISMLPITATLLAHDAEVCFCGRDRDAGELYELATMPCGHQFDSHCIRQWLERCHTCPNCRYPLLTGQASTDAESLLEQQKRRSLPPD